MALARLELDYRAPGRRIPWVGIALFCAAAALTAWMVDQYRTASTRIARLESRNSELQRHVQKRPARPAPAPVDAQQMARQYAQASAVLRQLGLPWDALFREVEAAGSPRVALLAIEPDAGRHTLRISGEARDLHDVIEYTRRLSGSRFLRDVYLQSHQVQTQSPDQPVRFALMATWGAGR